MLTVPNLPLALPAVMILSMAMAAHCGAAEAKRVSVAGAWGGCQVRVECLGAALRSCQKPKVTNDNT